MSTTVSVAEAARGELSSFGERLIGPDDARYDEARALFNAMIDQRPALIARCATADDVAAVIRFAREHDVPLAVRGGGHNGGGLASVDDGVVDRPLADEGGLGRPGDRDGARRRRRRLGRGRRGDRAAQPRRARPGSSRRTGVAGLTLGGGHGYLARRHGLTIDNLLSAEMVLADGSTGDRERRREPGSVLGDPRRRRQLRRRHRVHVPGAPARDDRRRADVLGDRGRGRAARGYREWLPSAPRNVTGFFNCHTIPPAPSRSRRSSTCARSAASSGASTPRTRRPSRRWPRCSSVAEPLDARRRADADRRAQQRVRRPLRPGRPVVLARPTSSARSPTRRSR